MTTLPGETGAGSAPAGHPDDGGPAAVHLWIARIFPVKHFADGMQAGFLGTPFRWTNVLVVAAWGVAGLLLAMRFFSWEPRKG